MQTTLTRLSRPQVETIHARFPAAIRARAIIIRGGTVVFRVPTDAQLWDASPQHVLRALVLSEKHQAAPNSGRGIGAVIARLENYINGMEHRDIRVSDEPETTAAA